MKKRKSADKDLNTKNEKKMKRTLIIADDHLLFLKGMEEIFSKNEKFEVLSVISDGNQVVKSVSELQPDLVILDLNFKTTDGFSILKEIKKLRNSPKVVFVTMYNEQSVVAKAKSLGANGFFLKETDPDELATALYSLKVSDFKVSSNLPKINILLENSTVLQQDSFESEIVLTSRETDIVRLITKGKTAREIASELNISPNTVDTHRKNIQKKLGVNKISELVSYAISKNIVR